jgi:membrane protease subunit (stomatin/prohibitin family)
MGLLNWVKNQLIDVIEFTDDSANTLVWRFPRAGNEIKNGAQLIVREGQVAVFVHEGQIGDVFKPGRYQLTTANIPVLTSLSSWKYGFNSPFKCEVYFVSTKQYTEMRWGTANPIPMRDPDFGMVRVRAFGGYAIKVNPDGAGTFIKEIVGTDGDFKIEEIEGVLRRNLLQVLLSAIGSLQMGVLQMSGNAVGVAQQVKPAVAEAFSKFGVLLTDFQIESISLPPEIEKAMDERAKIGAMGGMQNFVQAQAAYAMRDAAQNQSGMAGLGAGVGAGIGVGQMMGQAMAGMFAGGFGGAAPMAAPVAPAAPAAPAPAAAGGGASVADRLKKLKDLHAQGLIDDATFAAKRDAILAEI